ncbi:MAG: 3-deoxy-D-manno-octulosonic acid transferase [Planctomycetes bacterium]|nr:3-deoxy-D-manno-octulosonic acid transferase [Planctomycetota bacterium]
MSHLLNLIYILLLIVASPWIVWRRVTQGRYKQGWREKLFGNLPRLSTATTALKKDPTKRRIWFHAVSVGELQVIRPVIELAQSEWPDLQIIVTTSTDSGYELAKKLYSQHQVAFAPLDFTWAIRRALDRIEPDLLVMAELELWPNWLSITARQGIPIAIINARLSARSLSGYLRIAPIITSVLSRVDWIGTQSETYRDRFLQLGYPNERIDVTGNIKFDGATPDRKHPEVAMRRSMLSLNAPQEEGERTVWLCGSTQSPEESLCLQAMSELLPRFPGLRMILVPRHAERFDEVAKLVEASGLPWIRRSQLTDAPTGTQWRVLLADSVGELRWWWGLADIGFVGGSFGSRGGQNMIEPCAYAVATSFGPNTRNFTDVVQLLLESDGAVQFQDPAQIVPWVTSMIENPSERQALQERAKELVQKQRGAVQRTWSQLKTLIASND